MENKTKFNIYTKLGWIVTAIPAFVIVSFIYKGFEQDIFNKIGAFAISVKWIFLAIGQVCMLPFNRIISIKYEAWVLGGEMNSCVLNSLMGNNAKIGEAQMKKISKKVFLDFGDKLPTKEEIAALDEKIIRSRLVPIVRNINNKMKDCKDVLRYRNGYVDTRKLVSSNISAIFLTSMLCIYLLGVREYSLFILFLGLLYFYLFYLLANIYLLKWYGGQYSKVLLEQYLLGVSGAQGVNRDMRA